MSGVPSNDTVAVIDRVLYNLDVVRLMLKNISMRGGTGMDAIDPLTAWYLIAAAHDAMTPLIATTSSLYPPPPPPAPAPSDPHPPGKDAPHATVRNLFYVATGRMCNHKESVACGIVIADEFYRRYGAAAPKDHSPPGRRRVYPSVDHPWITDKLRALDSQFG